MDYLLGHPAAIIEQVVYSGAVDGECAIAARIDGEPVAGFGASDCGCSTHLRYAGEPEEFVDAVRTAHRSARDER